jgi:hypothetical protein
MKIEPPAPPAPKKKRRKKRRKGQGRKPKQGVIRIASFGRDYRSVHFVFSEDVIDKLVHMHDEEYGMFVYLTGEARYRTLRLQFARLADIGMPAILIRIEPPTYDPHGSRMRRTRTGRQYAAQILASKLRLKNGIQSQAPEYFWADQPGRGGLKGVIVQFDESEMLLPSPGEVRNVGDLAVESSRR